MERPRLEPGSEPAAPPQGKGRRRLAAILPLLAIYAAASLIYGFQASQHSVPWLFQDELFYASQAREYADTGKLTIRGGSENADNLTARITSIAWHFDDPETDYLAAKLLNVLLMAAAAFPAYALARLVVRRPAALFAAAATVSIPAFVYSSMILTEPVAYLAATTAFWLIARTLACDRLTPRAVLWGAAALAACYTAHAVRSQLQILFVVFGVSLMLRILLSERARRRPISTSLAWIAFGAALYLRYRDMAAHDGYLFPVHNHPDTIGFMVAWAFGAFAIGLAVVPVVLGIATVWPDRERRRLPGHVSFSIVATIGVLALLWYTGVKGAYLYYTFAWRVEERNLMYVAPLFFVATAIFLERRRLNRPALLAALCVTAFVVYKVPYQLSFRIYSDAPGLAILSTANRHLQWTDDSVRKYLAVLLAVSAAIALAPYVVRRRRALRVGAVALAVSITGAALAAEVAADRSSRGASTLLASNLPKPLDWAYEATGGARSVLVATAVNDANGIWLTEFFNPNLYYLTSLDSTAPAPGPNWTLYIAGPDGRLGPEFPDARYAVVDNKAKIVGKVVRRTTYQTLYRIEPPLRLAQSSYGVMGDGWMGNFAKYYQLWAPKPGPGVLKVIASRAAWGGEDVPGHVTITVARVLPKPTSDTSEGRILEGRPFAEERFTIHTREIVEYLIPVPGVPFVVTVTVDPTFAPSDYGGGDSRQLGIQPGFEYIPGRTLSHVRRIELEPPAIPQ